MTDQIPAGLTRDEAQAVREWAERARDARVQDETVAHAARVILTVLPKRPTTAKEKTMTDQIPADDVREIAEKMHHHASQEHVRRDAEKYFEIFAKQLEALLPPRPTLAETAPEERRACQWMQADVAGHSTRYVIANPYDEDGEAALIAADGWIDWIPPEYVTPRPDLPRLEWPDADQGGEEGTKVDYVSVAGGRTAYGPWTVARLRKKADAAPALPDGWRLADHEDYGRGIVTNPTPNRDGRVYYVFPADDTMGYDWLFCDPDELTFLDTGQGADQ